MDEDRPAGAHPAATAASAVAAPDGEALDVHLAQVEGAAGAHRERAHRLGRRPYDDRPATLDDDRRGDLRRRRGTRRVVVVVDHVREEVGTAPELDDVGAAAGDTARVEGGPDAVRVEHHAGVVVRREDRLLQRTARDAESLLGGVDDDRHGVDRRRHERAERQSASREHARGHRAESTSEGQVRLRFHFLCLS